MNYILKAETPMNSILIYNSSLLNLYRGESTQVRSAQPAALDYCDPPFCFWIELSRTIVIFRLRFINDNEYNYVVVI